MFLAMRKIILWFIGGCSISGMAIGLYKREKGGTLSAFLMYEYQRRRMSSERNVG